MENCNKDFKEREELHQGLLNNMFNAIELYITLYGNPHMTIIATQKGVEILCSTTAKGFELKD